MKLNALVGKEYWHISVKKTKMQISEKNMQLSIY